MSLKIVPVPPVQCGHFPSSIYCSFLQDPYFPLGTTPHYTVGQHILSTQSSASNFTQVNKMDGYVSWNYWERTGGGGIKWDGREGRVQKKRSVLSLRYWMWGISGTVATIVATLRDRANMRRNPEVKRTKNIRQKSWWGCESLDQTNKRPILTQSPFMCTSQHILLSTWQLSWIFCYLSWES